MVPSLGHPVHAADVVMSVPKAEGAVVAHHDKGVVGGGRASHLHDEHSGYPLRKQLVSSVVNMPPLPFSAR